MIIERHQGGGSQYVSRCGQVSLVRSCCSEHHGNHMLNKATRPWYGTSHCICLILATSVLNQSINCLSLLKCRLGGQLLAISRPCNSSACTPRSLFQLQLVMLEIHILRPS